MHPSKYIPIILAFLFWIGLTGCIHTYPSAEVTVDPTEIDLALLLSFEDEWSDREVYITNTDEKQGIKSTRGSQYPRRIYLELKEKSGKRHPFSKVMLPEEAHDGLFRLELPFKLKAETYHITVWCDCLQPSSLEPAGYDISDINLIKSLVPHGEESDRRICLTASADIDLRHLSGQWNSKEEMTLPLVTPMARFRLIAVDYQDFLQQTEEARRKGERYTITVNYDSDIPAGYSLLDNNAIGPLSGVRFSSALPIITFPGVEMSIGSDWLFNPPGEYMHTITVTVLNSAQVIVSQTSGITFPLERGHVTSVKGKLLTNFITGGIQIDNVWAGEIIIEIN